MMKNDGYIPGSTLGIVGGGQLGRMLLPEARKLGLRTAVYSASADDPAAGGADVFVQGLLDDADGIAAFARQCDYLTIEIEHVALEGLQQAEKMGCSVFPSSRTLGRVQDKLEQRRCFVGLSQPHFSALPDWPAGKSAAGEEDAWRQAVLAQAQAFGFPLVQKTRRGGYDGRGVAILRNQQDVLSPEGRLLCADSYLEALIPLEQELAVIVARSTDGSVAVFPPTEMRFDPDSNICTSVAFPARCSEKVRETACAIAAEAAQRLDVQGLLAVELFVDGQGEVFLNEVAPRPHNSGHGTIEGLPASQYAQHLRAGLGLPLGAVEPCQPTVIVNMLGAPGAAGRPLIQSADVLLRTAGANLHWYGKKDVRPGRKMGHFTVTAETVEQAIKRADAIAEQVRVIAQVL